MIPDNFRIHPFKLFNKDIQVAGMAGFQYGENNKIDGPAYKNLCDYLRQEGFTVLIGLNNEHDHTGAAKAQGLEYTNIPVMDFARTPLPCQYFDQVYQIIKKATQEGKKVAIQCGAGNGRTGTALATLKVRELIEQVYKENPETIANQLTKNDKLDNMGYLGAYPASPIVIQAINKIRTEAFSGDGSESVERTNDVDTIENYAEHVVKRIIQGKGVIDDDNISYLEPLPPAAPIQVSNPFNVIPQSYTAFEPKSFQSLLFADSLYAGAHPTSPGTDPTALQQLKDLGVTKIYSLEENSTDQITTTWKAFGDDYTHEVSRDNKSYFIKDMQAPDLETLEKIVDSILDSINQGKKIYLHCQGGYGRTGTILVALYMKKAKVDYASALKIVRDTYHDAAAASHAQKTCLKKFEEHIKSMSPDNYIKNIPHSPIPGPIPGSILGPLVGDISLNNLPQADPLPQFQPKSFAPELFGTLVYAGSNPQILNTNLALDKLKNLGITKIYALEKNHSNEIAALWKTKGANFSHETSNGSINYFIPNNNVPDMKSLHAIASSILASITKGEKIYLHCQQGIGRTGLVLAAVFMKQQHVDFMTAIKYVKANYHNSANTYQEEINCLKEYEVYWKILDAVQQLNDLLINMSLKNKNPEEIEAYSKELHTKIDQLLKKYENTQLDTLMMHLDNIRSEAHIIVNAKTMAQLRNLHGIVTLKPKLFAPQFFNSCVYAGGHPFVTESTDDNVLKDLSKAGITKIYSLEEMDNKEISNQWTSYGPQYHHETSKNNQSYFIPDFKAPKIEALNTMVSSMLESLNSGEKIYLHCMGGKGRTGTILAALYMRKEKKSAEEAVQFVRSTYHPKAVETVQQIQVLKDFEVLEKQNAAAVIGQKNQDTPQVNKDLLMPNNEVSSNNHGISNNKEKLLIPPTLFAPQLLNSCVYAGGHPLMYNEVANPLDDLKNKGITKIYSLEEKYSQDISSLWATSGPQYSHETSKDNQSYFIHDFNAAPVKTLNTLVNSILDSVESGEKIYLHCLGGKGRTGMVLAALYMRKENKSAEDAIKFVRNTYCIHAIESNLQVQALMEFENFIKQNPRKSAEPTIIKRQDNVPLPGPSKSHNQPAKQPATKPKSPSQGANNQPAAVTPPPTSSSTGATTKSTPSKGKSIGMWILSGFITALGIAAVAVAFIALNALSFNALGLGVAVAGGVAALTGLGLFAYTAYKNRAKPNEAPALRIILTESLVIT